MPEEKVNNFLFDIETNGLDAMQNRVICITVQNVAHEKDVPYSMYGEDEKLILEKFWNCIKSSDKLYGFNIDEFDVPFLLQRSFILGVRVPDNFKTIKVVDLRKVLSGFWYNYNKFAKGKLSDWARLLLINIATENGEQMLSYYEKKDWKKIVAHAEEDVFITHAIYRRLQQVNLI